MRITFLLPGYIWGPSGGIRVVYEHANKLVARGHEISIIQPRRLKFPPPPPQNESAYYWLRRQANAAADLFRQPTMHWLNIDPRVTTLYAPNSDYRHIPDADALFATAWQTVRSVLECPKSKGEKFYLIQHYETFMGPQEMVDATWRAALYKAAVSKWLLEVGVQLGCNDVTHIPNAIDHQRYRLLRAIEGRAPRVAMTFSKESFKGAADGIEALQIARERHPHLQVVFFGLTKLRPAIPEWIEYHCNPPQDFIVEQIYNRCSIFLCPSWAEGYALPPAEAAACGCAIVSTDNGGIRDYIENGVAGLLSRPQKPALLADNLCLLLDNERLRVRLATAANHAVRRLDWEQSAAMLENFIVERMQKNHRQIASIAPALTMSQS